MRSFVVAAALLIPFAASAAFAQSESSAQVAQAKYSTAGTVIGALLDDPAARAVLDKHMPAFSAGPQISMARGMTLKAIQQYAPNITNEVLAAIDSDLALLSKK